MSDERDTSGSIPPPGFGEPKPAQPAAPEPQPEPTPEPGPEPIPEPEPAPGPSFEESAPE